MISKKYIKDLEFHSIEDFFNYVIESKINGNYTQTKEFITLMSEQQYIDFKNYLYFVEVKEKFSLSELIEMRFRG